MRLWPAVFVVLVSGAAALWLTAESNAVDPEDEGGEKPAPKLFLDSLTHSLPIEAVKTYQSLYPEHLIWQVSETGTGNERRFELIVFHPRAGVVQGRQIGEVHVQTLANYKLVLTGTGTVIREEIHPLAEGLVPQKARDAFDQWRRPYRGRDLLVEWWASQEEGQERIYRAHVDLNALEGYSATLKADGTIVEKSTRIREQEGQAGEKG